MSSDRTIIAWFFIFIFTDFRSCFEFSAVEAMLNFLRWKQCNQSSNINSSSIIFLESSSQYWKCNSPNAYDTPLQESSSSCSSWCRTIHTWWWTECLLHVCHPEIVVQILSSRRISFFTWMDFVLGCFDKGLLLLPLPPLLLSRRPGFSRFVEATVFPMHAGRFDRRFNVVRILWTMFVIFHGRLGRS